MDCEVTFFSCNLFHSIIATSKSTFDFRNSFDIHLNKDKVKKAGVSGGGASGELFMFSHDSKLILKTISHDEFVVFQKILYDYCRHLTQNKDSLIGRILGLFKVKFEDTGKIVYLTIIENLFVYKPQSILRKYDLKGSTYSRRVLPSYKGLDKSSAIKGVLKDIDFLEIEASIKL